MSAISNLVYSNKPLSKFSCFITRILHPFYKQEIRKRSRFDILDYKSFAKPLPRYYSEILTENNSFGIGFQIRRYAGFKKSYINALIEHGYFFGKYVSTQAIITFSDHIFTFGDRRIEHLKAKVDKNIHPIGPYIHYAEEFLNIEEFNKLKMKIGKTLLVFFAHSATGTKSSFDLDYTFRKIEEVRKQYNTVVVSLFWSDLSDENIIKRIQDEGYLIFSAGHRYDLFFLSRLKSMILLSDMTMSNNVGTHVGYCIYYDRPHWVVNQDIKYTALSEKGEANVNIIIGNTTAKNEKREIVDVLSEYSLKLTDTQRELCSRFFGFDYVKSPQEMLSLLENIH